MNFPPIDHDSPIRYVPGIFAIFVKFPLIYGTHWVSLIRYVPGQFTNFVKFPDMTHTKNTSPTISEYDITKNIFANSYPWLFPGGIGNMYDMTRGKVSIKDWGNHLLQYYYDRFLEDSLFGLFLYNTIQRHSSFSEGNFFLSSD